MSKTRKQPHQFWERYTPEADPAMIHYLTPLETALFKHRLQPFQYEVDSLPLKFDHLQCYYLYQSTRAHILFLSDIVQSSKINFLKRDPAIRHFLTKPLQKHQLPRRLHNALHFKQHRHMADVAAKGEHGLLMTKGIGKNSREYLIELFHTNGCGILFPLNKIAHPL